MRKIREEGRQSSTVDLLEFVDELLHASRFADTKDRSALQLVSDQVVSLP